MSKKETMPRRPTRFPVVYDVMLRSIAAGYVVDQDLLRMHVGKGFPDIVDFAPYAARHTRANIILSAFLLSLELLRRQGSATIRPKIPDPHAVLGGGLQYPGPVNADSLLSHMNAMYASAQDDTERAAIQEILLNAQGIEINYQQRKRRRR